jgi:hypothetical protein
MHALVEPFAARAGATATNMHRSAVICNLLWLPPWATITSSDRHHRIHRKARLDGHSVVVHLFKTPAMTLLTKC